MARRTALREKMTRNINERSLTTNQKARFARHIMLPQVGEEGQKKIISSSVLVVGAGGLGSPVLMYLAAAGIGKIGIIDDDIVDITRIAEPNIYLNENRVDVEYTIFAKDKSSGEFDKFTESHAIRHLSLPEVDILANKLGFERVCTEEFLTAKKPGPDTWGVCVVLKKI